MIDFKGHTFHDTEALLDRLTYGLEDTTKSVVFVVGAPLTAPIEPSGLGVANVNGVINLIREVFASNEKQRRDLELDLEAADNKYQSAFSYLLGRRSQDVANRIVRQAVWGARRGTEKGSNTKDLVSRMNESELTSFDDDVNSWYLSPGVEAIGELIATNPKVFGESVVTSNFDPLINIAVRKAGGIAWRSVLHADGNLEQSTAPGCHVVHIHGFWHGSDTLHTNRQLLQSRPTLRNSLLNFLTNKIVVVIAYGGWDDIFTNSLADAVSNQNAFPEVIWTFYSETPDISPRLNDVLRPGLDRGRVTFYSGVDCNNFLPILTAWWRDKSKPLAALQPKSEQKIVDLGHTQSRRQIFSQPSKGECDRPPIIDVWVGREAELRTLEISGAKVVAICGIGGQGKSALAATYLKSVERGETAYCFWDWRDCKEEGDRIRTQLIASIERFTDRSQGNVSFKDATDADLVNTFISLASQKEVIFIFDNVDHYVDLDKKCFVGILDAVVNSFSQSNVKSRMILTCRPQIQYTSSSIISFSMPGLSLDEAVDLFSTRLGKISIDRADIEAAHTLTEGHAFWLDLMAVQVARVPGLSLANLLEDIRRGRGDAPDVLSTIWKQLADREKILLRAMAEIVRPETEEMLDKLVSTRMNYSKFSKALRYLKNMNLIVVKKENNSPDLYDLHPLVRSFVQNLYSKTDRVGFIDLVIKQYIVIIKGIDRLLGVHLPLSMLERWSQKVELEVEAGRIGDAFATLSKVNNALVGGGHSEEYIRVARKLLESIDWISSSTKIKEFDEVVATYIFALTDIGRFSEADDVISRYEITVPNKTARYINLCNIKCYSHWARGDYPTAVEWGTRGLELKERTNVDTGFDCKHNLALAKRDAGQPGEALKMFLNNISLEDLISNHEFVASASTYGNVGRCLHKLGRHDDALKCYRKSAIKLEDDESGDRLSNQAWAREWIGECLAERGNFDLAFAFYTNANAILRMISPFRASKVAEAINLLPKDRYNSRKSPYECERTVKEWLRSK
ncbi:tetratricopeptide repeat protein [Methylobacterium komagatae]